MFCYDFYKRKIQNNTLPVGSKRGPRENYIRRFSEGGGKRGKLTITTSTITARRKGTPQHYVEGKKKNDKQILDYMLRCFKL